MTTTMIRWCGRPIPMQLWYTLTTLFIVLMSVIICLIPYVYQHNDEERNDIISDMFENRLFQDSLLISTVIGFPLMVDVVLDSFALNRATTDEKIHWGTRLLLLMSLVVPSIFHYFCIQISAQSFAYSTAVVNVTSRGCICIFLSLYHQNIGIGPVCISTSICYAIVEVLWLVDFMRGDDFTVKISLVFTVITWLQLLYIFFRWQITWKVSGREKNSDDVCIALYLSSLCVLSLGNLVISSAWNDPTQVHPDPVKTSLTMYMQILFVITSMTVSSRVARYNLQKTACTMNERQAFVRYISHELRTPLNAVFLGMTFIKEELKNVSPLQKVYVERIVDTVEEVDNCCQIAISILNDLLTFDKLEEGKMMLDFEETAVAEYISDAVKPFRVEARTKNILITIDVIDHESGWENATALQVDRHKMSQVIRNILSNAIKFTPSDGSVTIKISRINRGKLISVGNEKSTMLHSLHLMRNTIVPLSTHGNHTILSDEGLSDTLRIEVTDNGAGISIDDQKKLFGQYVQFNAGKLQKGNGSGLGLWISKGIVELHGGSIGAYSAGEGEGSTFFIELPLYPKGTDTAFNKSSLPKICSTVSKKTSRGDRFGRRSQSRSASTRVSERPTRKSFVHDAHRLFEFSNGFQSSSTIIRDRSVHSTSIKDDSIFVENSGLYKKEGITRSASSTVITDAIKIVEDGIGRPALKVLVVDDSAATRKIMERLLTNKGYEVNTAVDGVDCLRIVNEGIKNNEANFNLIVMDDNMPNMSGPATSKILRANNYSGIICGVTGNTTSADISNFKNHGATLVLPKPLNLTILEAALSSCDLLSLQG